MDENFASVRATNRATIIARLGNVHNVDISEDENLLVEDADQDKEELVDDGELDPVLNRFPGGLRAFSNPQYLILIGPHNRML